ncbi:MAG: response regulator [Verrucomicrobia bacterium]|nr:response regulator [Verrucomicrobiota bacterium]
MKPHPPLDPAALRHAAEARVKQRHATGPPPTEAERQRLHHELEVHQIELEMQNESLLEIQTELQAALERYTDLYDFAPVGYLSLGPGGEMRQLNLTAATLLGADRFRLVNRRLGQFLSLADRTAFGDFLERVFAGQRQACEVALSESPMVVRIEAARLPSGQECQAVLTDITERRQAEEALQAETLRRRLLWEQSPDGIVMMDPQTGRLVEFNTAAHQQLGYSREEFARLTIFEVEAMETALETKTRLAEVGQRGRVDFVTLHRTRQGEIRNVQITAQSLDIGSPQQYQCIWRDITERQRIEHKLRQLTSVAEQSPALTIRVAGDSAQGSAPGRPLRILIAEDHEISRGLTIFMLGSLGYRPDFAVNGREAVGAWERSAYDLILMDCQMPEMDGFEATREIRRREAARPAGGGERVRIVAVTANTAKVDLDRCLAVGMDGYLRKPYTAQQLDAALREHCDQLGHASPATA